jgi:hypothetical protein
VPGAVGDRTYKNHLDGDNQMDLITGKGPSARHEPFYFGGPQLGTIHRHAENLQRPARPARRQRPRQAPRILLLTDDGNLAGCATSVYAVALNSSGKTPEASALLEQAHQQHPADRDVLVALVSIARDQRDFAAALGHARELLALDAGNAPLRALVEELERKARR